MHKRFAFDAMKWPMWAALRINFRVCSEHGGELRHISD
jgi:hypothetical protein